MSADSLSASLHLRSVGGVQARINRHGACVVLGSYPAGVDVHVRDAEVARIVASAFEEAARLLDEERALGEAA